MTNSLLDQVAHDAWREDESKPGPMVGVDFDYFVVDSGEEEVAEMIREGFDLAQRLELGNLFLQFGKGLLERCRICGREITAVRAGKIHIRMFPAPIFLEALAALRAGDRDGFLALCVAHGGSSQ